MIWKFLENLTFVLKICYYNSIVILIFLMQRLKFLDKIIEKTQISTQDLFSYVNLAPPDPILKPVDPNKINLGVGAYRDQNGNPYVFKIVKKVEQEILNDKKLNKQYLPIDGLSSFVTGTQKLIFGQNSSVIKENHIASIQTLSGTGSLRIGFQFLASNFQRPIYISNPTWLNHKIMVQKSNIRCVQYPYFSSKNKRVDIQKMIDVLNKAQNGSIILLHACAHNPTGVDPTIHQWMQIAEVMQKRGLVPYFDSAYQGFASGSLDKDAWAIRYFINQGFQMIVSQSLAKNMGLYGQRIGALHVVCTNKQAKDKVLSQLKHLARLNYSNPPLHGARIADRILNNKQNFQAWKSELIQVAQRIIKMREALRSKLEGLKTPGTWNHITDQIGMFSYTGLTEKQCDLMINKYNVHLLRCGRISMAGINMKNVEYIAQSIKSSLTQNH